MRDYLWYKGLLGWTVVVALRIAHALFGHDGIERVHSDGTFCYVVHGGICMGDYEHVARCWTCHAVRATGTKAEVDSVL